ncbi:MurR/RpiR family transcriptional regulator [Pelagibacterium xiamenense]|uniref:MurR/RpiR family transcriptional regulator n=1 Tax=Pelagibacterium xiamenense TaxID=2901140 RepID=UPI001E4614B2|nr:MurR/RpiR family transcriptional regulator [Pelagibacterium xiamenense]MCD7060196.1 MurR/RpiR family transcriptional regulator [Pelagibacterium xiamenense]
MSQDTDHTRHGAPPRDFDGLQRLIVERRPALPKRLAQVAEFALVNPDEIAFGTAASIAAHANVQPSTLVRFSQALGYQGFSEMQEVFRARLRDPLPNYDQRLAQLREHGLTASSANMIMEGFANAAERSLVQLKAKLDPETLDSAVTLLANAETIYLIGLRRSFPVTSYMAYALGKLGVPNVLINAVAGLAPEQTAFISPRDAALVVSFAPYASETVSLAQLAHDKGARIVSITDSLLSPIATMADAWFEVAESDFEGFRTMGATMILAMTLAVAVADKRKAGS